MSFKKIILLSAGSLIPQLFVGHVFAGTPASSEAASRGVEGNKQTTAAPQNNVNQGASQTSSSNTVGQVLSTIMGAALVTKGGFDIKAGTAPCGSPKGCSWGLIAQGVAEIAMGGMSFQQAAAHSGASGQANFSAGLTDGMGNHLGSGNLNPTMDPNSDLSRKLNSDPFVKNALNTLADLQNRGILDAKKGTLKVGGKTFKMSDFSSAASMAAAGIPKSAIDGAIAAARDAEKLALSKADKMKLGAMTASSGYEEGGGGGSSASAENSSEDAGFAGVSASSGGAGHLGGIDRGPSNVSGMQKMYNGEPIGVAADDIFGMMNRRYQLKHSQESFLTEADLAMQK